MSQYLVSSRTIVLLAVVLFGAFALSGLFSEEALAQQGEACGGGYSVDCGGGSVSNSNTGSAYSGCGPGSSVDCGGGSVSNSNVGSGYSNCGPGSSRDCANGGSSYQRSSPYFLNATQRAAANKTLSDVSSTLDSLRTTSSSDVGGTAGASSYSQPGRDIGATVSSGSGSAGSSAGQDLTTQDKQAIVDALRVLVKELSDKLNALEKAGAANK